MVLNKITAHPQTCGWAVILHRKKGKPAVFYRYYFSDSRIDYFEFCGMIIVYEYA